MISLGDLAGGTHASVGYALSSDGSVVVGTGHGVNGQEAFRWTQAGGMQPLGVLGGLPGNVVSHAKAVSADGSVVVGVSGPTDISNAARAYRWTEAAGMIDLGLPPNGLHARAEGVSADGTVVTGAVEYMNGDWEAFIWTEADGFLGLGDLPGGDFVSAGLAISGDGLVVVGQSNTGIGAGEAFRWTLASGMVSIGDLPGGQVNTTAWATNYDGSIIVGSGSTSSTPPQDAAFIWDAQHGMRNLKTVLEGDYGLDLTGWHLNDAKGLSADGRVIVGNGVDPNGVAQAWLVRLPVPEPTLSAMLLVVCSVAIRRRGFCQFHAMPSAPRSR